MTGNIDDPVYETIAQRADLIIFVQSSNSAISKVSKDFLDVLKENNKNVPVCLVHNFFEAAHWHSEEEKQKNNAEQKQFAINEIKELGFNINEEHCFCINLGKVKDARARNEQGEYLYAGVREQILQPEADKYTEMEKELYARVVSHRDEMQLQNCLNRTKQQLEKLEKRLKEELEERQKKIDEYKRVEGDFKKLSISESFNIKIELPENIYSIVGDTICIAVDTKIKDIHQDNRFTRSEAIAKVKELIVYCEEELYKMFAAKLDFGTVENSLYATYLERKNGIQELIAKYNLPFVSCMKKLELSELPEFSLKNCVDVTAVVPPIPISRRDFHYRRHKKEHIKVYFNTVKDRLIGTTSPTVVNSYIQEEIEPIILKHLKDNISKIETDYLSSLHEMNDCYRTQLLKALIPEGLDIFVQVTDRLNVLLKTIQKIKETINSNRRDEA